MKVINTLFVAILEGNHVEKNVYICLPRWPTPGKIHTVNLYCVSRMS